MIIIPVILHMYITSTRRFKPTWRATSLTCSRILVHSSLLILSSRSWKCFSPTCWCLLSSAAFSLRSSSVLKPRWNHLSAVVGPAPQTRPKRSRVRARSPSQTSRTFCSDPSSTISIILSAILAPTLGMAAASSRLEMRRGWFFRAEMAFWYPNALKHTLRKRK